MTSIQWTDRTWNPVTGCTKVSEGCRHCYAEVMAKRTFGRLYRPVLNDGSGRTIDAVSTSHHQDYLETGLARPRRFTDVQCHPDRLDAPLRWRKPCRVFVNSMSDLFHEAVPDEFIDKCFAAMALASQHTFQVLTKRPERMRAYLSHTTGRDNVLVRVIDAARAITKPAGWVAPEAFGWPYRNVWLGTSIEDQPTADQRIPDVLATPAAVRFVSLEPMLGRVNITRFLPSCACPECGPQQYVDEDGCCLTCGADALNPRGLDWVIVGGESGPKARNCDVAWIRSVVQQCRAADVRVFVKQVGARPVLDGQPMRLRDAKGGDPAEWPEDLRVREFPEVRL